MRKGAATRTRILDEAGRMAAKKGFGAVSLGEVALAVGLTKSGLFRHFTSKEAMELQTLERVFDRFVACVWTPAEPLTPGRERLLRIFDLWLDWTDTSNAEGGCPILAAGVEFDDQPGAMRELLKSRLLQWRERLAREMRRLRDPPPDDAEIDSALFQMKAFILGHVEALRLLDDPNARKTATDAFVALIDRVAEQRR